MPVVFDSVLSAALARELHARWSGRRLEALRFEPEERRVLLHFRDECWVWLLHPREGVVARLADSAWRHGERGLIDGPRRVVAVDAPLDVRQITIRLDGPAGLVEHLGIDLPTNRWNAVHVADGRVRSVLVPDLGRAPPRPGDEWTPSASDRRWARTSPEPDEWSALAAGEGGGDGSTDRARPLRRHVAWLSGTNESWVLGTPTEPGESYRRYLEVRRAALEDPPAGWLVPAGAAGGDDPPVRPYVCPLDEPDAERVGSTLDALGAWGKRAPRVEAALRAVAEDPETTALREALEDRHERARKKIRALEAQVDTGEDPEQLRRLGHLLLARKREVPAGAEEVRLEDFFGEHVVVPLDPALDAVGNAEARYDEAKRLERAAELIPRRIAAERRRIAALEAAVERLDAGGPDDDAWKLAGGRRRVLASGRGGGRTSGDERLPYRVYRTSSGLEVRAGRSARANDELTFHHSAPDDIWMHVREAPGSHVILRWSDRDQNPPERDLAEAALVAAVLSRARGSTVVPVAWTRRKYVRKPRKAAPGAVVPDRTSTVFVEPDAGRVERMAEEE